MTKVPPAALDNALRDSVGLWSPAKATFALSIVGLGFRKLRADQLASEDADTVEGLLSMVRQWLAAQS